MNLSDLLQLGARWAITALAGWLARKASIEPDAATKVAEFSVAGLGGLITLAWSRLHLTKAFATLPPGATMSSAPASKPPPASGTLLKCLTLLSLAPAAFLGACATLQPGADPIVVRAEQSLTTAKNTFSFVLTVDQQDRGFWRTNAPAFHNFCEWLRQPITIEYTNTLPRDLAICLQLDDIKNDYKASRASSNALYESVVTLESTMTQAGAWTTIITNALTK